MDEVRPNGENLKRDVAVNRDNEVEVGAGYNRIKRFSVYLKRTRAAKKQLARKACFIARE